MPPALLASSQVAPARTPDVVGALLDCEAPDEFITNLILSVRRVAHGRHTVATSQPPRNRHQPSPTTLNHQPPTAPQVRSLLPVEGLVEAVERRNRLKLLTPFLEHLISEGSQDPHVHNALGASVKWKPERPDWHGSCWGA